VLAFGTGIALLPERAFSFAIAKLPVEAAGTATMVLLLVGLLGGSPAFAQTHVEDPNAAITPARSELEEQLRHEMGCVCGTCAHEPLSKCTCSTASNMRAQLREQIEMGKNREEVLASFIEIYGGQQFLTAPIDRGFNRLAWLVPYGLAGTGIVLLAFVAARWSRRQEHAEERPAPLDPGVEERLDDELRNLD
jgi:cytochrome c-type biogenesis protein CcmH/NrfF